MANTIKNCSCGEKKPYRRAYACCACWNALGITGKHLVLKLGRTTGNGTLRAGGEYKDPAAKKVKRVA